MKIKKNKKLFIAQIRDNTVYISTKWIWIVFYFLFGKSKVHFDEVLQEDTVNTLLDLLTLVFVHNNY